MSNDTISQLQNYRIILTATQGRTGTQLLAELLNLIPGVHAEHEPAPPIDNVYWRLADRPALAREWLQRSKLPAVLRTIQESGAETYVETSHMLCKGFFRPLRGLGIDFDLIIHEQKTVPRLPYIVMGNKAIHSEVFALKAQAEAARLERERKIDLAISSAA